MLRGSEKELTPDGGQQYEEDEEDPHGQAQAHQFGIVILHALPQVRQEIKLRACAAHRHLASKQSCQLQKAINACRSTLLLQHTNVLACNRHDEPAGRTSVNVVGEVEGCTHERELLLGDHRKHVELANDAPKHLQHASPKAKVQRPAQ